MAQSPSYQPVMPDLPEKATIVDAQSDARPGLWTRITNRLPFLRRKRGIIIVVMAILVIIGGGLSGLAALHNRSSRNGGTGTGAGSGGSGSGGSGGGSVPNDDAIKSDAYFYGDSPAVYPSRKSSCSSCRP